MKRRNFFKSVCVSVVGVSSLLTSSKVKSAEFDGKEELKKLETNEYNKIKDQVLSNVLGVKCSALRARGFQLCTTTSWKKRPYRVGIYLDGKPLSFLITSDGPIVNNDTVEILETHRYTIDIGIGRIVHGFWLRWKRDAAPEDIQACGFTGKEVNIGD